MATFEGATYDEVLDKDRLLTQLDKIYEAIKDGNWYSLAQLASMTGAPEASVSAQLRNLRKQKHGGHIIDRRRVYNFYEYSLVGQNEK